MMMKIRKWACSVSSIVLILNGSAAFAQDCASLASDVGTRIADLKKKADTAPDDVESDYASATSKDYANKLFSRFEDLNKKAIQASQLINQGYNLAGYTSPLKEGQQQTKIPPVVTNTMSNAEALAQAAADDDNTKLDILSLRCSQSTEQTALSAYLAQADAGTVSSYEAAKYNVCKVVHILADLQDKRQKLNDIRENGYPLFYLHEKEKKSYDGHSRTIQLKVDLRLYPVYPEHEDQDILLGKLEKIRLSYNSYFKWSDNNWTKLNVLQKLVDDQNDEKEVCWGSIKITSSVKADICSQVYNISTDSLKIKVRAKFKYSGDTHAVSLGTVTVPAPFGYLSDLSDMKEKKMQDLQAKVVDRIASLFGAYGDVIEKAQSWQKSCS
ncbi:hypothetical protein [Tistrella mobilis]